MRSMLRALLVVVVVAVGVVVAAKPAVADPSYGSDAAFPFPGVMPNTVLEPAAGAPVFGPTAPPPATLLPSLIAPPNPAGFGEVEDISYGDENPTYFPLSVEFSVAPGFGGPASGHPAAPAPPPPLFDVRMEAGILPPPPFGDGVVDPDVYTTFPGPFPFLPPCGVFANAQILDGDGAGGPPFGPPRLGLNMPEPGSNLDAYERLDTGYVTSIPGAPLIDAPVFFTIDAATAAGWAGPIPAPTGGAPVFAMPGPADVLAWNPAIGGPVIYATAAALGLPPGSDIDALAVTRLAPIPLPSFAPGPSGFDFAPAADIILFSLAPGSPPLAATSGGAGMFASVCFGPGTATAGDLFVKPVAFGPPPIPWLDAEQMGLSAVRSGGPADDNVDAVDLCNAPPPPFTDIDGDMIVDACDFDKDGDGTGNAIDPDVDGDGVGNATDNCVDTPNPLQENNDGNFIDTTPPLTQNDTSRPMSDLPGDACDADDDNDGVTDTDEASLPGAACPPATAALDPLNADTDGDGYMDGPECLIGTNPSSALSKPTSAMCAALAGVGVAVDSDGDKILDRIEVCGYGTATGVIESDADGMNDGCEVGSLNTLAPVNSGDQLLLSQAIIVDLTGPFVWNADLNKDGANNSGDQLLMAGLIMGC